MRNKYKKHRQWIYAVYKGEEFLTEGTREEICKKLKIKKNTFYYYRTRFWEERVKNGNNHRVIIRIE